MTRFIDLFAGIGGIRIGMEQNGFECVMSSEIDKECQRNYYANFGEMPLGDIKEISEYDVPDHDVLCAGFPCQPFSISGKQKGFEDTRGTLFFEICRIISTKKPSVVFLENVKHLVYHDHGRTLSTIISKLWGLGYVVSWRVLNGLDFGVPQNRERIIIVGSRRGMFNFDFIPRQPRVRLIDFLDKEGDFDFLSPDEYTLLEKTTRQPGSGLIFAGYRNKSIRKVGVRPDTVHLSRVHKQPNRIYSVYGTHPTLPSQESSGRFFILTEDRRVRKLTIGECWRIMGFPESYKKLSATGEQYRQLGNSVCIPMISAVASAIKQQLFNVEAQDNDTRRSYKEDLRESPCYLIGERDQQVFNP
ncbi:MAG: DNA (cytosine-5-)-methyltransferase [Prevotellaceae bacterium]|nr:DNA (cytosine-5-)-methyltransferase [Prevotellaceae bacterium]